jgi:hypothetical protein
MSKNHWYRSGQPKCSKKNTCQCHSVHHKSYSLGNSSNFITKHNFLSISSTHHLAAVFHSTNHLSTMNILCISQNPIEGVFLLHKKKKDENPRSYWNSNSRSHCPSSRLRLHGICERTSGVWKTTDLCTFHQNRFTETAWHTERADGLEKTTTSSIRTQKNASRSGTACSCQVINTSVRFSFVCTWSNCKARCYSGSLCHHTKNNNSKTRPT